ncbi:FMN-binding negative transcriptional regulator [Salinicola sp. LHM]|uniref:FMN-binding negative transcriptional regulator n=1 Tax=Salinicola sp. LHM TaxID=3065298 RepID=UPI002ACDC5B1|nr:FMN-binding negative transcriptional regulator [Salinicola sp. LHM]WQH32229.1 FMN-binding negative transcriptional regulator [Salinicola sp. LHM]
MYQPNQFRLDDPDALKQAIDQAPFATLVTQSEKGEFTADHLPLLFEAADGGPSPGTLRGHIARANPLASSRADCQALAIFHGPQAYITPSWYPAKREHGKVVPTWNYQVVHAHGRLRLINDTDWLRQTVALLTRRFERDRPAPWSIDDAPDDYIAGMCRAIVGIELTIERLEGKRKASQHKPMEERESIQQGLRDESGYDDADSLCLSGID